MGKSRALEVFFLILKFSTSLPLTLPSFDIPDMLCWKTTNLTLQYSGYTMLGKLRLVLLSSFLLLIHRSHRYFPKDQIAAGPAGHRHDWEGFVVWATGSGNDASSTYHRSLTNSSSFSKDHISNILPKITPPQRNRHIMMIIANVFLPLSVRAICPARHGTGDSGKYHCDKNNFKLDGNRPKILYRPDGTHAIFTDGGSGGFGSHNLAYWNWMPQLARDLLHWADYGSAQVPILGMLFLVFGFLWVARAATQRLVYDEMIS